MLGTRPAHFAQSRARWGESTRAHPPAYRQRRPESTELYRLVSGHIETCLAEACEHYERGRPSYVERELRGYLECGIHAYGFLRARCRDCGKDLVGSFSCKRRGVCPSCNARRMCGTAAHLSDVFCPTFRCASGSSACPSSCACCSPEPAIACRHHHQSRPVPEPDARSAGRARAASNRRRLAFQRAAARRRGESCRRRDHTRARRRSRQRHSGCQPTWAESACAAPLDQGARDREAVRFRVTRTPAILENGRETENDRRQ